MIKGIFKMNTPLYDIHLQHQWAMLSLLIEFDRICRACDIRYSLFAGTLLGAVRHEGFIPWDDDADVIMMRSDYERFLLEAEEHLDKERFYLQKEFDTHWPMFYTKLRLNRTTFLEKYHPKDKKMHEGVFIDIFPCDNVMFDKGKLIQFAASKVVIAKSLYKRGYVTTSKAKKVFMQCCRLVPLKPMLAICKAKKCRNSRYVHVFLGGASSIAKSVFEREWVQSVEEKLFEKHSFFCFSNYDALLRTMYGEYMILPPESERRIKEHAFLLDLEHSYEKYVNARDGVVFNELTRSIR